MIVQGLTNLGADPWVMSPWIDGEDGGQAARCGDPRKQDANRIGKRQADAGQPSAAFDLISSSRRTCAGRMWTATRSIWPTPSPD